MTKFTNKIKIRLNIEALIHSMKIRKLKIVKLSRVVPRQRRKRRLLAAGLGLLIFLGPLSYFTLFNPKETAAWYDDDWGYRKAVTISNSGSELTDMQVKITFDTKTLITEGKLQSDCDDIRVTNNDGNLLTHAVVGCNNTYSEIWVRLATVPTYDITLYVYYGNATASDVEDGDSVFEFYDNFDDGNYDGWTVNGGTWSASTGVLESSSGSHAIIYNTNYDSTDYIYESTMTITTTISGDQQAWNLGRMVNTSNFYAYGYRGADANTRWELWENLATEHDQHDPQTMTQNAWVKQAILFNSTTIKAKSWAIDSASDPDWQLNVTDATHASGDIGFKGTWAAATVQFDDAFVRKYVATDPTSSAGSEEIGPGPVAYWKMDEGYGTAIRDTTANGNNLNLLPLTAIEQQINIIDQDYTVGDIESYTPTDNSLGIVNWDGSKYDGATVYFEAVIKDSSLGGSCSDAARAYLYDTYGNQISGATARPCTTTFGRDRSSAITLTDGTDYTVRFWNNSGTGVLRAARLIVIQSNAEGLTDTETQIEVGAVEKQGSSTATQLTDKKVYYYDSTKFDSSSTSYFEASLRNIQPTIEQRINIVDQDYTTSTASYLPTDNSLGLFRWDANKYSGTVTIYFDIVAKDSSLGGSCSDDIRAALYTAGGSQVSGSITRVCSTSYAYRRSSAITLTDDTDYTVRVYNNGGTGVLHSAWLTVVQSQDGGIVDTRTQIEVGDYQTGFTNTSYSALTDYKIYNYDQAQFSATPESSGDVEFHATLKIDDSADTVYAELFNCGNASTCTPASGQQVAVISHTGDTNWTLIRGTNVDGDADWDTSNDDNYVVRVQCSGASCSGNIANAKIVLDQNAAGGITDVELVHQQVNSAFTDADTTYTDQDFFSPFNPDLEEVASQQGTLLGGTFTYYYEATLMTDNGSNAAYAQLRNDEDGAVISNSEIQTSNTSYSRVRSGDITSDLPSYPSAKGNGWVPGKDLDTQLKNNLTSTTSASSTWMIIQASNLATSSVTAYADLYNLTDTSQVSGSEISTTSTDWTRVRSNSLTLTTGKEYTIRLKSGVNNAQIYMANAKIVHDQLNTDVTAVEVIHQQINSVKTDSDTGYTEQDYDNEFDPTNFSRGTFTYYFEATLNTDNASNNARAELWNDTDNLTITSSEVTTTDTGYDRVRSGDITANMPSSAKTMETRLRNASSDTTSAASSWLIIQGTQITAGGGDPEWKTEEFCVSKNCLFFNGTDDAAIAANTESIDLDQQLADGFTFQTWVRVNSDGEANQGEIFDKGTDTYLRITNDGTDGLADLEASVSLQTATASATITNGITLNKWHHVAFGYTDDADDEITVYIDAVNQTTSTNGDGTPAGDSNYLLLGGDTSNNYHGFMDEFKIYNEERTEAQIRTDFIKGTSSLHGASTALGIRDYSYLSEGLTGYWKMDEGTNNDRLDSSGNGNTLTESAGDDIDGVAGKFNQSADFEDTDTEYLTITDANQSGLEFDGDYTVNLWVNFEDKNQNSTFISKGAGVTDPFAQVGWSWINGGPYRLYLRHWEGSGEFETSSFDRDDISDGTWYMMTVAYDDDTDEVIFCLDGVCDPPDIMSNEMGNTSADILFGQSQSANYLDGKMDELRVYNRALSPSEVEDLYNWAPGPVGYWNFDENTGTTAYDRSGNENNGTLRNATSSEDWMPGKFGSGLRFDATDEGTDDGVLIDDPSSGILDFEDGQDFTVMGWFNRYSDTTHDMMVVKKVGTGASSTGYNVWISTADDINVNVSDGTDQYEIYSNTKYYSTSGWNHFALVWDDDSETNTKIYVNGVDDTGTTSGTFTSVNNISTGIDLIFGEENDDDHPFDGVLDDIKIYDYARSSSQVIEDMNAGHPAPGSPIGSAVGHWQFDEGHGDTAYDASGNSNDGDLQGTCPGGASCPVWTNSGKFNKALSFDGSNDYLGVTDPGYFDNVDAISFAFWFNTTDWTLGGSDYNIILEKRNGNNAYSFQGKIAASTELEFYLSTGAGQSTATIVSDMTAIEGEWHHVVGTYDGANIKTYLDGEFVESNTQTGTVLDNAAVLSIGGRTDTTAAYHYNGVLDEVKVYSFALTADQVKGDMNKGSAASFGDIANQDNEGFGGNPPVGWWKLDENTGTGSEAAKDTSGNDNHLDMESSMTENNWVPGKHGSALDFDANDDFADITSPTNLDVTNITLEAWAKSDIDGTVYTSSGTIINRNMTNNGTYQLFVGASTDVMTFGIRLEGTEGTSRNAPADDVLDTQWHHYAGTYDGSVAKLYVDGVLQSAPNSTAGTIDLDSPGPLAIGSNPYGSGSFFDGLIDEVKVYNYARTQAQVAYDFNRGKPLGYWKLDDCQGTNAVDNGSGGNDGTITIDGSGDNTSAGTCSGSSGEAWFEGATGKRNASLDLDGTDDYVNLGESQWDGSWMNHTILVWAKHDGTPISTEDTILSKGGGGPAGMLFTIKHYGGGVSRLSLYMNSTDTFSDIGDTMSDGNWHLLGIRLDASNVTFYIDGEADNTEAISDGGNNDFNLNIGRRTNLGDNFFDGQIDEVKIFNYALTTDQIKREFNNGAQYFGP